MADFSSPLTRPLTAALSRSFNSAGASEAVLGAPVVLSITATAHNTGNFTNHLINMPATVAAGDLLAMLWIQDGAAGTTTPAGWTLRDTAVGSASDYTGYVFTKVAAGTEGGTQVDCVTSAVERGNALVYRIQAGTFQGTPETTKTAAATSATSDPPAITPTWGSDQFLVITAAFIGRALTLAPGYPYTNGQTYSTTYVSGTDTNDATVATCWQQIDGTTENPGAYTLVLSTNNVAMSIAVRGA